jgi:uridine kinase
VIVAIDGLDGSGKSRLAAALADALTAGGHPAELVHVDDFRRPLDFEGLDAAAETALYYERYFDFAALTQAVSDRVREAPDAVVIIEGVMPLRAGLPAEVWLVVLEVSPDEARRRIQLRDQAKGRSREEVARRIDRRYFPAHARYRRETEPAARAHVVIDNEDWRHPRLVRRAPDLPPELARALAAVLGGAA